MQDSKKKSRLGRGLSSLMGMNGPATADISAGTGSVDDFAISPVASAAEPGAPRGTPALLPIDQVVPNPRQPRRSFDEASLAELAASITANGLIQPITVRAVGSGYELIAGERRLRASKLAGLVEIPAYIRDADELAQAQLALVENIQREDLNPIDRAAGYRVLVHELGLSQAELAGRLGEDRSTIANHLRLLDLPDDVRDLVRAGTLSLGHAKVICGIPHPAEQTRLAQLVVSQSLSVRNLEKVIAQPVPPAPTDEAKAKPSAHLRDLEVNMSKQLGMRVQVRSGTSKGKGKVVIHYTSLDEFDTLLAKMGVELDE